MRRALERDVIYSNHNLLIVGPAEDKKYRQEQLYCTPLWARELLVLCEAKIQDQWNWL
jgi:hypothetical protein